MKQRAPGAGTFANQARAYVSLLGGTVAIAVAGVAVIVPLLDPALAPTPGRTLTKFEFVAGGSLRYIGTDQTIVQLLAAIPVRVAGGAVPVDVTALGLVSTDNGVTFPTANGIALGKGPSGAPAGIVNSITVSGQLLLSPQDIVQLQIANNDSTEDLDVTPNFFTLAEIYQAVPQ